MIRLPERALPASAAGWLVRWQQEIDQLGSYPERVEAAKRLFKARNTRRNKTFEAVKAALTEMCSGVRCCCYCEHSLADEVEHIRPKDLYPESVFQWENYLYACGPCNGPKNAQFAVISHHTGELVEITRPQDAPVEEPEPGEPALVNPRTEDPMTLLYLDIVDTFEYRPMPNLDARQTARVQYTIRVLHLDANEGETMIQARAGAFRHYRAHLREYVLRRDEGADSAELDTLIKGIQGMEHPSVWYAMKQQRTLRPELEALFAQAPEALDW